MAVNETLRKGLKKLRLSIFLDEFERLQNDPSSKTMNVEQYLEHLVEHEIKVREIRAIERRIRAAQFPTLHCLEEYDFDRMQDLDRNLIVELHSGDWISKGDNTVFCGGHGLGKTHLATSMGVRACERGYRVYFRKADKLVLDLLEAQDESRVLALRKKLLRVDLLIIDELGYTPFDKLGGELLHGVISDRYDARKSVIVTTNLKFGRWSEIFKSKEMTVALLDRLTHRCDVIVMEGQSKRYEESVLRQQRREKKGA